MECLIKFTCEAIWSRAFVCWEFFDYCFNFIVYSDSLIFPDLVLEDCIFLGIYPFCPGCWHIVVHNIFLQSFVFLWCQLLFLLFHFWFYLFGSFLFISWRVLLKFVNLHIFSKNQLLDSLISYFLPSTHFGLCCSFSSSFKCKVRLLIWDFSCFLR